MFLSIERALCNKPNLAEFRDTAPLILIYWIMIYPVDGSIQLLNKWGHTSCKR